jgi:hypothetical protein
VITNETLIHDLRRMLRARAAQLALDPDTIESPTPGAVTARRLDGSLVRLDVSTYRPAELSL